MALVHILWLLLYKLSSMMTTCHYIERKRLSLVRAVVCAQHSYDVCCSYTVDAYEDEGFVASTSTNLLAAARCAPAAALGSAAESADESE